MAQKTFNPIDYGFRWTQDGTEFGWYEFDQEAAIKAAKAARDQMAKAAKADGFQVTKFSLGKQRITRGGIGSSYPEVDFILPVYGVNIW